MSDAKQIEMLKKLLSDAREERDLWKQAADNIADQRDAVKEIAEYRKRQRDELRWALEEIAKDECYCLDYQESLYKGQCQTCIATEALAAAPEDPR